MAVREFGGDAAQGVITVAAGGMAAIDGDPATLAAIWKPANVHAGGLIYGSNGAGSAFNMNNFSDGNVWYSTDSGAFAAVPYGADGWQLVATTNVAGVNGLRRHKYIYDTDTWSHAAVSAGMGAGGTPVTEAWFGRWDGAQDWFEGKLAVVGVWASVLSDGDLEGLTTHLSAWLDLAPAALWRFNQAATTDDVVDLTGGGADQTSITGTTVATGDDPPGFSFAVGAGGGRGQRVSASGLLIRSGGA